MNTIFKKSLLASLCIMSLVGASQAHGMFMAMNWIFGQCFTNKTSKEQSILAPDNVQEFAKKCYAAMDQFKNDYYPSRREKIDQYVAKNNTIQVFIEKIKQNPQRKGGIVCSNNSGREIFIDRAYWEQSGSTTTNLTPHLKKIICHEVTHSWFGHRLRECIFEKLKEQEKLSVTEYLQYREVLSKRQKEFEANTLMVQTLHVLGENDAITTRFWEMHSITSDENDYLLGFINGISKIKDEKFKTKTINSFIDAYNKTVTVYKNMKNDNPNREELRQLKDKLNRLQQMCISWKPVRMYSEALDLTNEILQKNKQKNGSDINT